MLIKVNLGITNVHIELRQNRHLSNLLNLLSILVPFFYLIEGHQEVVQAYGNITSSIPDSCHVIIAVMEEILIHNVLLLKRPDFIYQVYTIFKDSEGRILLCLL